MKKSGKLAEDVPTKIFRSAAEFESWLQAHPTAPGVWLQIAKKDSGETSVSYPEAVDVALCHGWIDGVKNALDETWFLQCFTPRRRRSIWSKINVGKVERLIAEGRMRPGGLREVEAAKSDGRWQAAYGGGRSMEVPEELARRLKKSAKARKFFEALNRTNRYAFCWRVQTAKKPETREARAAKFVEMMEKGETLHA